MEGSTNLTILYFVWWYGEGYAKVFGYIKAFYIYITDLFSVTICLKTLFAPWKRDKISYEGLSLQQQFQVWALNMSSRFIGFIIKLITLTLYIMMVLAITVFSIFLAIFWPILPALALYLIYFGIQTLIING